MNQISAEAPKSVKRMRVDLQLVADLITSGSRVLDIGCGDGALLSYLASFKQVDGRGLEISMARVRAAVSQGLPVIQGNLESDLKDYPAGAFDYVVLSQTLQATVQPRQVLEDLLRIGRRAIVSLPNFGHWRVRWSLMVKGRMPMTKNLPDQWYDTPNIHLCTILDFVDLCKTLNVKIEQGYALSSEGLKQNFSATGWLANVFSEQAVFVLTRNS
ncbi:MAG: methionine biosynthesis protein MetW [Rhodospirillaceae bacterium]|nr:methionine biosynthesis protein MetW [Rhodospirillaceae bacterium]